MARKEKLKDNGFLFAENELPQLESFESRQKCRRAADAFDRLKADHQKYVAEFGRTWLMEG